MQTTSSTIGTLITSSITELKSSIYEASTNTLTNDFNAYTTNDII